MFEGLYLYPNWYENVLRSLEIQQQEFHSFTSCQPSIFTLSKPAYSHTFSQTFPSDRVWKLIAFTPPGDASVDTYKSLEVYRIVCMQFVLFCIFRSCSWWKWEKRMNYFLINKTVIARVNFFKIYKNMHSQNLFKKN